ITTQSYSSCWSVEAIDRVALNSEISAVARSTRTRRLHGFDGMVTRVLASFRSGCGSVMPGADGFCQFASTSRVFWPVLAMIIARCAATEDAPAPRVGAATPIINLPGFVRPACNLTVTLLMTSRRLGEHSR